MCLKLGNLQRDTLASATSCGVFFVGDSHSFGSLDLVLNALSWVWNIRRIREAMIKSSKPASFSSGIMLSRPGTGK